MAGDPQAALERREAARHLVQHPLTCAEHDPDVFRLVRRHETELDRWFTQRLGYRLHVDNDTARLFKTGAVLDHRPLTTKNGRPLNQTEHVLLALVLASTAAGPAVISLRDLVNNVRSAAAEAEISLSGDAGERRAVVTVLRWMVDRGLASELHAHVDAYAADEEADAVLKVRPDRIVLLPLPLLVGVDDPRVLVERAERRDLTRQWLRCRLVEDPVVYRDELEPAEWAELRRRLGEEERLLDEMFGLILEARAEGVATIDPTGALAARRFPGGGTVRHAALLILDGTRPRDGSGNGSRPGPPRDLTWSELVQRITDLAGVNARRWANDLVAAPERLARQVLDLLEELRLAERVSNGEAGDTGEPRVRLLPAAARFRPVEPSDHTGAEQEALW